MDICNLAYSFKLRNHPGNEIEVSFHGQRAQRKQTEEPPETEQRVYNYWAYLWSLAAQGDERAALLLGNYHDLPQDSEPGSKQKHRVTKAIRGLKPERGRGLSRMAAVLEVMFGRDRCGFLTLTIPGSTEAAIRGAAEHEAEITKRFTKWTDRKILSKDGAAWWLYKKELQKRGALHWHFLLGLPDNCDLDELLGQIQAQWYKILCEISDKYDCDLFARKSGGSWRFEWPKIQNINTTLERIKKSCSRYLAKYVSKEVVKGEVELLNLYGTEYMPRQWWGASKNLKQALKDRTAEKRYTHVSSQEAESAAEECAKAASWMEAKVYPKINPYTKALCGFRFYCPDGEKDNIWKELNKILGAMLGHRPDTIGSPEQILKEKWKVINEQVNQEKERLRQARLDALIRCAA